MGVSRNGPEGPGKVEVKGDGFVEESKSGELDRALRVFEVTRGRLLDTAGLEEESAERSLAVSGINIGPVLDLCAEGDSKTIGQRVKEFDNFFRERVIPHEEARRIVGESLSFEEGRGDVLKRIYEGLPPEMLYPAATSGDWGTERGKREIMSRVSQKWDRNREPFVETPVYLSELGKDSPLAPVLESARTYGRKDWRILRSLGVEEDEYGPAGALLYQMMCLEASQHALLSGEGHRGSYASAQISNLISKVVASRTRLSSVDRDFLNPSLELFPNKDEETQQQVRRHIDAVLSMIMPDRGKVESILTDSEGTNCLPMIQEDFISVDLMALAQEHGLAEEYEDVFENLFLLRNVLHIMYLHMTPSYGRKLADGGVSKRMSLIDVIKAYTEEHDGEKPSVASLGYGKGILEQLLLKMDLVSDVVGVDLHDEAHKANHDTEIVTYPAENLKLVRVPRDRADSCEEKVFGHFPGGFDIVIACDSLHETEDPFSYMKALFERVNPGGNLYITDPTFCEATDGFTKCTLHEFDLTRHPASMLPIEAFNNASAHLVLKGAKIQSHRGIVPGVFGGSNDHMQRRALVFEKGEVAPFELPKEDINFGEELQDPYDIFKVWPLSLVPDKDREKVVHKIEGFMGNLENSRGMRLRDVKNCVLKWLLGGISSGDIDEIAETLIYVKSPYKYDYLNRLFGKVGDDPELVEINRYAGEAIALIYALRDVLGIDISDQVCKQDGWERLLMDDMPMVA